MESAYENKPCTEAFSNYFRLETFSRSAAFGLYGKRLSGTEVVRRSEVPKRYLPEPSAGKGTKTCNHRGQLSNEWKRKQASLPIGPQSCDKGTPWIQVCL